MDMEYHDRKTVSGSAPEPHEVKTLKSSRRALASLLSALLLASSGCIRFEQIPDAPSTETAVSDPAPGNGENDPTDKPSGTQDVKPFEPDFETVSEALALALTGWGTDYLNDPNGLWSVVGYYAALSARKTGTDADPWISRSDADALCALLRPDGEPLADPVWLNDGDSALSETKDGVDGLRFVGYEKMLDNTLGVWRALFVSQEDGTYIVRVEDHLDDGAQSCLLYAAFQGPSETDLPPLVYLVLTDPVPLEGTLADRLTYENLIEANRVETLLFRYVGVKAEETSYFDTDLTLNSTTHYLVDDPGIMSVTNGETRDGAGSYDSYTNYTFWDGQNALYGSVDGRGVSASVFVDPEDVTDHFPGDSVYSYDFYDAPIEITEETDTTVTFRSSPEILEGGLVICTVDRESLAVLDYARYDPDGALLYTRHMEYGLDQVAAFIEPLRRDVSDQRIIRCNVTLYDQTSSEQFELYLHVPRAWELTFIGRGDLFLYAKENFSSSVSNPVEPGQDDLTLWITNAAG